jgi:phage terminase large subunit GpA-like protein
VSEVDKLLARRERYTPQSIPNEVLVLLAAIDTRDARLPYLVTSWGEGHQCWLIEYAELPGDIETHAEFLYSRIDLFILDAEFRRADGTPPKVLRACQDARGHRSETVYAQLLLRSTKMWPYLGVGAAPTRDPATLKPLGERQIRSLFGVSAWGKDLI